MKGRFASCCLAVVVLAYLVAVILCTCLAAEANGAEPVDVGGWRTQDGLVFRETRDGHIEFRDGWSFPANRDPFRDSTGTPWPWVGTATATIAFENLDTTGWRQSAVELAEHPAVVRIGNQVAHGTNYGTGTLVDKDAERGIVVTCYHLFRNERTMETEIGTVTCCFPGQGCFPAEVLAVDKVWDLAVLSVAPPQAEPVAIATAPPKAGDPIKACGYGSSGKYHCHDALVTGYVQPEGVVERQWLQVAGVIGGGDSGGPAFDTSGQLVAVMWGSDGRRSCGAFCGRVRQFLGRLLGGGGGGRAPPGGVIVGNDPSPMPGGQAPGVLPDAPLVAIDPDPGKVTPDPSAGLAAQLAAIEALKDSIAERLGKAEEAVSPDRLRGLLADVVAGLVPAVPGLPTAPVAPAAPGLALPSLFGLASKFWPGLAVGGGVPLAAGGALWLLLRGLKKRRKKKAAGEAGILGRFLGIEKALAGLLAAKTPIKSPQDNTEGKPANGAGSRFPFGFAPRDNAEVLEVLRLAELDGRSPLYDALIGRLTLDRLDNLIESDGPESVWAADLKRELEQRFNEIAPLAV